MSTVIPSICGHRRQLLALKKIEERGMPIQAFLFFGPDGVGKRTIAAQFFAGLFCQNKLKEGNGKLACLSCSSCIQIGELRHPDFHFISDRENKEIGIDEIRALKERLALTSWGGSWRGVLIDNAEELTPEAQSALLKILEEPSQGILFFLITSQPDLLLDTIRSRAAAFSFGTVGDEELENWFSKYFQAADRKDLLRFAEGRPGLLKRFAEERELLSAHQKTDAKIEVVLAETLLDQFHFADSLLEDGADKIKEFLGRLLLITRASLLKDPASSQILARAKALLDLHFELSRPSVNRRLVIDSALLALRGA